MSNSSRLSNDYFFSEAYYMVKDSVQKFESETYLLEKRLSKLSGRDSGNIRKANEIECAFIELAKKLPDIIDSFDYALLNAAEPEQYEIVKKLRDVFLTKIDPFESAYREKTRFFHDRFDPFVWAHIRNARDAADRLDFKDGKSSAEKPGVKPNGNEAFSNHGGDADDDDFGFLDNDTDDDYSFLDSDTDDDDYSDTDDGKYFSIDF